MIITHQNFPHMDVDPHCFCGEIETNEHIYECEIISKIKNHIPYKHIFSYNNFEVMEVYNVLKYILEKREEILSLFEAQHRNDKRKISM